MLREASEHLTHRKLRLLACGDFRRFLPESGDAAGPYVAAAEMLADGELHPEAIHTLPLDPDSLQMRFPYLRKATMCLVWRDTTRLQLWETEGDAAWAARRLHDSAVDNANRVLCLLNAFAVSERSLAAGPVDSTPQQLRWAEYARRTREWATQVEIIRDIFGNPFRPVPFAPSWRTTTAVAVVRQMYDTRDFAAMPVLADALQEAGCDSNDILAHCRGPGPHVRGCWVVDLVLGKA